MDSDLDSEVKVHVNDEVQCIDNQVEQKEVMISDIISNIHVNSIIANS